ncbi:MAG TPA: Rieske (2Fe-2S) protein [Thermoanaerobaculia bacterium]|nr:Rieske (2Fe-2S) protein [Thermoanaerobaculia bacterium]
MNPLRTQKDPLWREEVSIFAADERYVNRRQFAKFLVLTSAGMFVGNLWILVRSWLTSKPSWPVRPVALTSEIPVGGTRLFHYPGPEDPCILVRHSESDFVAYSQKCTHLSCAVYYSHGDRRLECPCHEGFFSVRDGRVLQGPPQRPLPRIVLERRGDQLVAIGVDLQTEAS